MAYLFLVYGFHCTSNTKQCKVRPCFLPWGIIPGHFHGNGTKENAIAICSGALHSCAVEYTGFVKCWGWGERGQLGRPGNGTNQAANSPVPVQVEGVEDAIAVVCGYQHSCAMSANETTLCWGDGIDRQLQRHDEIWAKTGRRVMRLNEILELSAPMPTAPMKSVW